MRPRRTSASALPSFTTSVVLAVLAAAMSSSAACAGDSDDDTVSIRVKDPAAGGASTSGASGDGGTNSQGGESAGVGGSSTGNSGASGSTGGSKPSAGAGGSVSSGAGGATGDSGAGGSSAGAGGAEAGTGGATGDSGAGGTTAAGTGGAEAAGTGGTASGAGAGGDGGAAGGTIDNQEAATTLASIETIAVTSSCYKYQWKDRGQAPKGYVKGVAKVFARAVCNPTRSDVLVVSKANTGDDVKDAISWFNSNFAAVNMTNEVAGVDTLRHAYTLLLGLGMRESSGEHCCGRDASATNTSSESAEAGAWQTSYDSRGASVELPKLFEKYKADDSGCLLDTFKEGVTCSDANWKNWGTGADGLLFQKMEKECPAFAAEYAAVMLRVLGGSKGHYGPLRTKAAEIRPECDAMFHAVQDEVTAHPAVCDVL